MIQRIQSLYLMAAQVIMIPLYSWPLAKLEISDTLILHFFHNRIESIYPELFSTLQTWPVTVLLTVIIIISFITVFQYKNRIRQIRLCVYNILLHFGLIGLIYFYTKYTLNRNNGIQNIFLWPMILPFISIILHYLGLKKIQKDESLIRSMDRIRP